MMTYQVVPLAELKEHPQNPRKTFDPVKLSELADSIREKGVLNPLLVRPNGRGFEILGGARRFRASQLAGLQEVPTIVRDLDDTAALELIVVDNLQRDDVHPLEEAEGYAALMKAAGYDVEQIAGKIGRSTKYVYDRVKLLQLIPAARKVFVDGEITAGHAILLARLSKADQERIIDGDDRYGKLGGLFQTDLGEEPGLELDDPRKAVSVRELQTLINDTVRFRPEDVDLPNLFPATAQALEEAAAVEMKVVKITRDHYVPPEARDEKERTYGPHSWKRADGQPDIDGYGGGKPKPSKTCDHSILGLVVAGPGRGEAFPVCVAKKKCAVHWKEEQRAANERGAPNGAGTKKGKASAQDTWQQQEARRREEQKAADAERARWKKAAPKLLEALAEQIAKAKVGELLDDIVIPRVKRSYGPAPKQMSRGKTIEDGVRYAAFLDLAGDSTNGWWIERTLTTALKRFGVNAPKIVDQVAPKPKPEKEPKVEAAKKPGARARRRAKKAAAK